MPYTHYNTDERDALQTMEGMELSKSDMAVILGKHPDSVYREMNRNGDCGIYTGSGARALSVQKRLDSRPSPKLGSPTLKKRFGHNRQNRA
jgi:IS30 family transposase